MRRGLLSLLAGAALMALLGGCTSAAAPTPTPSAPASTSALGILGPGDCLDELSSGAFKLSDVASTSCTGDHHWEVSEVVELTGDVYPGEIDLKQQADSDCAAAFTDYLGAQPGYSRYTSSYLVPDETAWADQTSRRAVCLAGSATQALTASIKGDTTLFAKVGECTKAQDQGGVAQVVPCSTEHAYEAYAEKKWTGKAAPTKAEADKLYTDVCVAAFTKFIGIDVGRSTYEIAAFLAPSDSWSKIADHRIVCTVGNPAGGITGSLKGIKK